MATVKDPTETITQVLPIAPEGVLGTCKASKQEHVPKLSKDVPRLDRQSAFCGVNTPGNKDESPQWLHAV